MKENKEFIEKVWAMNNQNGLDENEELSDKALEDIVGGSNQDSQSTVTVGMIVPYKVEMSNTTVYHAGKVTEIIRTTSGVVIYKIERVSTCDTSAPLVSWVEHSQLLGI